MRRRAWIDDPRLGRVPALLRGGRPSPTRNQEDTRHRREDNGLGLQSRSRTALLRRWLLLVIRARRRVHGQSTALREAGLSRPGRSNRTLLTALVLHAGSSADRPAEPTTSGAKRQRPTCVPSRSPGVVGYTSKCYQPRCRPRWYGPRHPDRRGADQRFRTDVEHILVDGSLLGEEVMVTIRRGLGVGTVSPVTVRFALLKATPHHSLGIGGTSRGMYRVKGVSP